MLGSNFRKKSKFIEVKGYERDRDKEKWKSVDNLVVIKEEEIEYLKNNEEKILEYIK